MDIQLAQIIFQIINFGVVVGALTFLLYKPVLKIFDERAQRIEEGQKAAEEAIKKHENLDQMRKDMQTKLKKERAQMLEEATEEAKAKKQEILAEARKEAQAEVEKIRKAGEDEKAQLIKDVRVELVEAVVQATRSLTLQTLDAKKDAQLIDAELNKLLKQI